MNNQSSIMNRPPARIIFKFLCNGKRIRWNPRRSMRRMALDLKVSRKTIQKVVKWDLGMQSFKRKKVHFLSVLVREKRLARSKELLFRRYRRSEKYHFFGWKIFTIKEVTNAQNDRVISKSISEIPDRFRYVDRKIKPLSLMVWTWVSGSSFYVWTKL